MTTGKWAQRGVPHRGWTCVDIEDVDHPDHLCEMCEVMHVRYVHIMEHPNYETLRVGCICAGNMEQDLVGARKRERDYKRRQSRRSRWLTRKWRVSSKGNDYLNVDGFNVVVYPIGKRWCGRIERRDTGRQRRLPDRYDTPEAAKLAAYETMMMMKRLLSLQAPYPR